jgi:hypothetical protein
MIATVAELIEQLREMPQSAEPRIDMHGCYTGIDKVELIGEHVYINEEVFPKEPEPEEIARVEADLRASREKRFADIEAVIPGMATVDYSEVKD